MAVNSEREIQSSLSENFQPVESEGCEKEVLDNFSNIKELLDKCTKKCLAPVRIEKISSCLAKVRDKNPPVFDSIVPQLIEHLQVNVEQELELMFQQENLVSLCHQLDKLVKPPLPPADTQAAWRPSGIPCEDIKDHILSIKLEVRQKLREKLKQLQDENEVLKNNLQSKRGEIAETEERITAKHNELQKVTTACDSLTSCNNNEDGKYSLENIIKELKK